MSKIKSRFTGRTSIVIPITREEFVNTNFMDVFKKYIGDICSIHNRNRNEIERLFDIVLGNHDIYSTKTRADKSPINNMNVENHLNKIVNFHSAFMYSKALDYSASRELDADDDITMLNMYINDQNKASKDIIKAINLYTCGVHYRLVLPKMLDEIDTERNEAPFLIENLEPTEAAMVYSIDKPTRKLFGIVFGSIMDGNGDLINTYDIYMPRKHYFIRERGISNYEFVDYGIQPYDFMPIIEYSLNKFKMGLVELGLPMQNLINSINSSEMDGIEEATNCYIIIKNQLVDDNWMALYEKLKAQRVMVLNTNNPDTPASVEFKSATIQYDAVNNFYERVVKALYDITSTPQSSGNVTSGGDTGQARLLGNGWESAQNQALLDQTFLMQFEIDELKAMISICKQLPNAKINKINANDITIKYNINMSDNLLVKTQSLVNLVQSKLPEKSILQITGLTNDVDGVGNAWIANIEKAKQEEQELTTQANELANANSSENNNDSNLQESK